MSVPAQLPSTARSGANIRFAGAWVVWQPLAVSDPRRDTAVEQFGLTWSLFEYHLSRLEFADFGWEAARLSWTMRRGEGGAWVPDFAEVEPDPVPVPTIAWLTWHLGWWLGTATDHLLGVRPRDRGEVVWPGPGEPAVAWLRGLADDWRHGLDDADLGAPCGFPWPLDAGKTGADLVAWANVELMKNVAEIGQLRLIRVAMTAQER